MPRALIAGAGPAGLACAIWLARGGMEVAVLESAPAPRRRPCGEGVMPPGAALLGELGVTGELRARGARDFRGISYWMDGHEAARADFPPAGGRAGLGLTVPRPVLEQVLVAELARQPLAQLATSTTVTGLVRRGGRVVGLEAGGREWLADTVIGADGRGSTVRRLLGLEPGASRDGRFGVCGHFEWQDSHAPLSHVEVHMIDGGEAYRTPSGPGREGWIFLTSGQRVRDWAGRIDERFAGHMGSSPPLAAALRGARLSGRVAAAGPLSRPASSAARDGVLLVGDAAGFLDAITGEGLAIGLRLAREAALLVLENAGRVGPAQETRYRVCWRAATFHPWMLTRALLFLARHRGLARVALRRLGRRPDVMSRLLGVNCGYMGLHELSLADWWHLLAG